MATVDMTAGVTTLHPTRSGNTSLPYLVEVDLDWAAAVTAKGSALAANDVIEVIDVPAGTIILAAGWEVTAAMTGTSTDSALDFGVTGGDVDNFVDGFDFDGASVGDYSAQPVAYAPVIVGGTADTLDILIQAQTGTITGGTMRVFAVLQDISDRKNPGIVALGS